MPKITEKHFNIAGNSRKYGIWYTESDKFFIKDFDENVSKGPFTHKKFGAGTDTFDELIEKAEAAIKEYEKKIAELKKVIVIDLTAAKSHLEKYKKPQETRNHYRDSQYEPEWISHIHGSDVFDGAVMGFYIEFKVKMFRKVGNHHQFYDIGGTGKLINENTIPNLTAYQIIDWTQEREDALNKLHLMFEALLDKFISSMKNPEQFIEAINQQKLLS